MFKKALLSAPFVLQITKNLYYLRISQRRDAVLILRWLPVALIILFIPIFSACSGPAIPHNTLNEHSDCLQCHGLNKEKPYPEGHAKRQYTNEQCLKCHKPASGE
jgi:hypothetical protein